VLARMHRQGASAHSRGMGTAKFTIGHLSDTHLGYEAYPALSASGNNQRGEDIVRSFKNVVDDIRAYDPPLVIHAGDVTEKPKVDIRYMLVAQHYFSKLAEIRPDGSRRQVVIVAGNHEQPRSRKEACWLELLRTIPGVHVVADGYQVLRFNSTVADCPREIEGVSVHGLPHDSLKEVDFSVVVPDPEASANVLVSHGVAMGSELFTRAIGREYPIDSDMLSRAWDYVALGHFHKRGPVGGYKRRGVDYVWYCGSHERISFRDLRDNGDGKGYLRVTIDGPTLDVKPVDLPVRAMFRLPVVDGTDLSAEEITDRLKANLDAANISGAIVGQIVEGVTRDLWSLLDISSVRQHAKDALHYEISARYATAEKVEGSSATSSLGDLELVLDQQIKAGVSKNLADDVRALAVKLLGSALTSVDSTEAEAPGGEADDEEVATTPTNNEPNAEVAS